MQQQLTVACQGVTLLHMLCVTSGCVSVNVFVQNIEHDFISGVLSEEELGNTMHVHEVESGFACQVRNLRSYDAISRAVLQRWSFPFLVDSGSLHGADPVFTYSFKRQNSYRCSQTAPTCFIWAIVSDDCLCRSQHDEHYGHLCI